MGEGREGDSGVEEELIGDAISGIFTKKNLLQYTKVV